MHVQQEHAGDTDSDRVWRALLGLAHGKAPAGAAFTRAAGHGVSAGVALSAGIGEVPFVRASDGCWHAAPRLGGRARELSELYLPVVTAPPGRCYVVGHLGQSLDGFIATRSGDSDFVTGPENLDHLHRMRALCKAIVVGAGTVAADDPELTTRRVDGPSPVRVILDPMRRLTAEHRVFRSRAAETWIVCAEALAGRERPAHVRVVGVPVAGRELALDALLGILHAAGLDTVFVEGGGHTVSRFLRAGLLDRVQIAIAPLVIGEGRPGLQLDGRDALSDCLRLRSRVFVMGRDVLFDCEPPARASVQSARPLRGIA